MKTKIKENCTLATSFSMDYLPKNSLSIEKNKYSKNLKKSKIVKAEIRIKYKSTKKSNLKPFKKEIKNLESSSGRLEIDSNTVFASTIHVSISQYSLDARIDIIYYSLKNKNSEISEMHNIFDIDNNKLTKPDIKLIESNYQKTKTTIKEMLKLLS